MSKKNDLPIFDIITQSSEGLRNHLDSIVKAIQPAQEQLDKIGVLLKRIEGEFKMIPDSTKNLASIGWYMPLDFPVGMTNQLPKWLSEHRVNEVDKIIMNYFDENHEYICSQLCQNFPNRSNVLKAGLGAHKNESYYLSTPIFLSQAEGIFMEITNQRFFESEKKRLKSQELAIKIARQSLLDSFLEPLKVIGAIRRKQTRNSPKGYNRHDVLHGDSFDYGENPANSYKALSLLNYINEVVYEAFKQFNEHNNSLNHGN